MSAHAQHSSDLQWLLIKRNSKFLQCRNGIRMSSDFMNNNSSWTKRHVGIIADKAAVVKSRKGGKALAVVTKDGAKFKTQEFSAGSKASDVAKAAAAMRPDLSNVAFRRARKFAIQHTRTAKIRSIRKERSSKRAFKHKSVRPKKIQ